MDEAACSRWEPVSRASGRSGGDEPQGFTSGGETEGAGEVGDGSESGGAIHFQRAAGLGFCAAGAVGPGEDLGLGRIDGAHAKGGLAGGESMIAAQVAADLAEEFVAPGAGEVSTAHGGGVAPSTGSAGSDDGNTRAHTGGDDEGFDAGAVHGVDHAIEGPGEQAGGVLGGEKFCYRLDFAARMDEPHARGEHFYFWQADGPIQRGELAVYIGDAHVVHVHHRHAAHTGAHERLHGPRAHAPHADDGHMGRGEALHAAAAVEPPDAAEPLRVVFCHAAGVAGGGPVRKAESFLVSPRRGVHGARKMNEVSAIQGSGAEARPWLFYTIAFDPPGITGARQLAKMLAGSVIRNFWPGDMVVLVNAPHPLFMVPRGGLREEWIETPELRGPKLAEVAQQWKAEAPSVLDGAAYEWVMFADADCLCLRGLEHLLRERVDADILYQPVPGRGAWEADYAAYLSQEETGAPEPGAKGLPPARCGITSGVWAVRGEIYAAVMEEWARIQSSEPVHSGARREQGAWNRLIRDAAQHGWRAQRFEAREIEHPLVENGGWKLYRDAALLHATGGTEAERVEFLFGHYVQRYFYDPALTLLNVLET
jgi:hypothetical protein